MREMGYKDGERLLVYVKEQADLYMKYLMGEVFRYDVIDDDGCSIDSKGGGIFTIMKRPNEWEMRPWSAF